MPGFVYFSKNLFSPYTISQNVFYFHKIDINQTDNQTFIYLPPSRECWPLDGQHEETQSRVSRQQKHSRNERNGTDGHNSDFMLIGSPGLLKEQVIIKCISILPCDFSLIPLVCLSELTETQQILLKPCLTHWTCTFQKHVWYPF